tara:strand:- start:140 stop:610 length:471 start_codon:yes stop_codon:yes gene_type:complete
MLNKFTAIVCGIFMFTGNAFASDALGVSSGSTVGDGISFERSLDNDLFLQVTGVPLDVGDDGVTLAGSMTLRKNVRQNGALANYIGLTGGGSVLVNESAEFNDTSLVGGAVFGLEVAPHDTGAVLKLELPIAATYDMENVELVPVLQPNVSFMYRW